MGFNIGNTKFAQGLRNLVGEKTSAKIASGANKALTVLTSPIQSLTNFKKAEQETSKKSALKLVAEGAENTLAVLLPFSPAGKAGIAKTATKAISTPKGIITTTAVAGGLTGALSTKTGRELVASVPTPSDIFTGTKKGVEATTNFLGGAPTEPDWYATARALGLGAGLAILASGGVYLGYKLFGDKLKKEESTPIPTPTTPSNFAPQPTGNTLVSPTPQTTPTEVISLGTASKPRKRRKAKPQVQNISQRVNIVVSNRQINQTKTIKRGIALVSNGIVR